MFDQGRRRPIWCTARFRCQWRWSIESEHDSPGAVLAVAIARLERGVSHSCSHQPPPPMGTIFGEHGSCTRSAFNLVGHAKRFAAGESVRIDSAPLASIRGCCVLPRETQETRQDAPLRVRFGVLVWLHIKLWGGYPPCSGIKNPSSEHLFLKGEKDMWKALL